MLVLLNRCLFIKWLTGSEHRAVRTGAPKTFEEYSPHIGLPVVATSIRFRISNQDYVSPAEPKALAWCRGTGDVRGVEREFFIDNLLVPIHLIIVMISVDRPCAMGV